jgi:RNA polymerase II subunit A-like phosphatase
MAADKKANCTHQYVFHGVCGDCGKDVGENMDSMVKVMGWGLNQDGLVVAKEKAMEHTQLTEVRLRKAKKLALIVDLDQTLLHTTVDSGVGAWIRNGTPDLHTFLVGGAPTRYYTKLRPGVREFLDAMHEKYEMHIFTFGTRQYALEIMKFLDPARKYFGDRILTKDESFDSKSKAVNLASLFPGDDRMVAIIDDSQQVWHFCDNLLPAVPYVYFDCVEEVCFARGPVGVLIRTYLP